MEAAGTEGREGVVEVILVIFVAILSGMWALGARPYRATDRSSPIISGDYIPAPVSLFSTTGDTPVALKQDAGIKNLRSRIARKLRSMRQASRPDNDRLRYPKAYRVVMDDVASQSAVIDAPLTSISSSYDSFAPQPEYDQARAITDYHNRIARIKAEARQPSANLNHYVKANGVRCWKCSGELMGNGRDYYCGKCMFFTEQTA